MNETARVEAQLAWLDERLAGCRIVDGALRQTILEAHRDGGMEDDARIVVVRRRPPSAEDLQRLEEACRARFEAALPGGLAALLRRHDGLWVGDVDPDDAEDDLVADPHYEEGVLPVARIREALTTEVATETAPDGSVRKVYWPLLPFYDVPDQGWHGLDFSRRASDGEPPVITYWYDEQSAAGTAHCEVVAPSFGAWLQAWIAAGFDSFWYEGTRS